MELEERIRQIAGMNKRILTAGLILTGISAVLCMFFLFYTRLGKPVFLYHYYEVGLPVNEMSHEEGKFVLYYIADRWDNRKVTGISFKEAPEIRFQATEDKNDNGWFGSYNIGIQQGENYGRYTLHSVYVSMTGGREDWNPEGKQLTQANFEFMDGTRLSADIGRIHFYKPEDPETPLESYSGSASSDGTASVTFHIKSGISLIKIDSPFMEEVDKLYEIKVDSYDGKNISGIRYGKGSSMTIYSIRKPVAGVIEQMSFYDLKPCIYFKSPDGKTGTERIYNLNYNISNRWFSQLQIYKYLRVRGEL